MALQAFYQPKQHHQEHQPTMSGRANSTRSIACISWPWPCRHHDPAQQHHEHQPPVPDTIQAHSESIMDISWPLALQASAPETTSSSELATSVRQEPHSIMSISHRRPQGGRPTARAAWASGASANNVRQGQFHKEHRVHQLALALQASRPSATAS